MLSHFSCVQLFVTLWTVAAQAPISMGFTRQEYWSGQPCLPPGDRLDPGTEALSPICTRWQVLYQQHHWENLSIHTHKQKLLTMIPDYPFKIPRICLFSFLMLVICFFIFTGEFDPFNCSYRKKRKKKKLFDFVYFLFSISLSSVEFYYFLFLLTLFNLFLFFWFLKMKIDVTDLKSFFFTSIGI